MSKITITYDEKTILDRIVDVQLMMKSLHRQSKKCDNEERIAKTKAKNCYKDGDIERARIFAEKAIQKRTESQHYQTLNARLSPILSQLKEDFAGRSNAQDCKELYSLLQEVTSLGKQNVFEVSQNEINSFIQNLNSDQSFVTNFQTPPSNQLADLEQRLANLRRRSPQTP